MTSVSNECIDMDAPFHLQISLLMVEASFGDEEQMPKKE